MLAIITICLLGGIAFAALAVILTRSKGNTLKDVLNSEAFRNQPPESMQIEIDRLQNKFKASAQIPVVALYVVSALVALGVPVLMISKQSNPGGQTCDEGEVTLSGIIQKNTEGNVYLVPTDLQIQPSGFFSIPLRKSETKWDYNIQSEQFSPVTLNVEYEKKENRLYVNLNNVAGDTLPVDGAANTARLPRPIELAPLPHDTVINRVTISSESAPALAGPAELKPFTP